MRSRGGGIMSFDWSETGISQHFINELREFCAVNHLMIIPLAQNK
jgi:hypothetical protein